MAIKKVRAKFKVANIQKHAEQTDVTLIPVTDGSEENKSFSKYTPSGSCTLSISHETPAADFFEESGEYYFDISKAPKA